jgi:hypothetical protein
VVGQVNGAASAKSDLPFLRGVAVAPLDEDLGRRSGALLGRARRSDVIDAAVVLLAADGDSILTSDAEDLGPSRRRLEYTSIVPV